MSMTTPGGTQLNVEGTPSKRQDGFLGAFRELLAIIRDYGMPTVAFGTGIYAFISVLQLPMATEVKAGVALVLTALGLMAQLWVYSRENPRVQSDEVKDQLKRMTDLVERLVGTIVKNNESGK